MQKNRIKTVDLFAGCGGMSLGFQNAGFNIVSAFENWQPAIDVYSKNFKHPIFNIDLGEKHAYKEVARFNPDLIIGGPPCQDFSIAGHRNFSGSRANLTITFSNIISQTKPKYFVMENVYNIAETPVLKKELKKFKSLGYGLTHGVLDASLMNVPQKRRRYIVIGEIEGKDNGFKDAIVRNLQPKNMTVRDYFGTTLNTNYYYMHPRSYARRAIFSIDESSATIRGVNRPIPQNYKLHPADAVKSLKKVRVLSSQERAMLQTFPSDFIFLGPKTAIEQMIGNAVPVNMAKFIADRLMEKIKSEHN